MPRPRQKIDPLGEGSELLARFKNEAPGWQRERMLAMEGTGTLKVADDLGRSQATVQSWINRFRANAIDCLLKKGKGPQSRLTPEMERAMTAEPAKGKWRTARDAGKARIEVRPRRHERSHDLQIPGKVRRAAQSDPPVQPKKRSRC